MWNLDLPYYLLIIYYLILVVVALIIIYETDDNTKTLGYLLVLIFLPVVGIFLYFSVGQNYRKKKLYKKKIIEGEGFHMRVKELLSYSQKTYRENENAVEPFSGVAKLIMHDEINVLAAHNHVELLINGEQKFPRLLDDLKTAKNHIHIAYYIYADDEIGNQIGDILIQKVKEGVQVRFMYDDFGSSSLHKNFVKKLRNAGVEIVPFYKIVFYAFANRMNYRNHRKIVVIDGQISYTGGINVDDRYINPNKKLYWRDTSVRIEGPGTLSLQNIFLNDWNFCAHQDLKPNDQFFPLEDFQNSNGDKVVQIVHSGPDSEMANIMNSLVHIIASSQKEILITNPYFIPDFSIIQALKIAALRGVRIKILVPGQSDSLLVNLAAESYYNDLMEVGIEIYRYQKGFVHAKTLVADRQLAVVGTANMDYRSFDLNFEVNAVIYNHAFAEQLVHQFEEDLKDASVIDYEKWMQRGKLKILLQQVARLFSPLL